MQPNRYTGKELNIKRNMAMSTIIKGTDRASATAPGDTVYALSKWTKGRSSGHELSEYTAVLRKPDKRLIWRKTGSSIGGLRRSGLSDKFFKECQQYCEIEELPFCPGIRHNDPAWIMHDV